MESQKLIKKVIESLNSFNASFFMSKKRELDEKGKREGRVSQSEKMQNVKDNLQIPLKNHLEQNFKYCFPLLKWIVEKKLEGCNDSVDIYASDSTDWEIIVEIDAARADQVAKKIVSRFSHISESRKKNILYIVLCYPGTESMNFNECKKYVCYGEKIIKRIHDSAFFFSAFVNNDRIECRIQP